MLAPAWDLLIRCMIAARDSPPSYPKNGGRRFLIGGFDMVTWGWTRFACITAPAFHGAMRVGEPLRAMRHDACRKPFALFAFEPQSQGAAGGSCFFRSWIHLRCCIPLLLVHTGGGGTR